MQLPTIYPHLLSSEYALTKRYEFWHYRSFWNVNKNTFWVKASYMNMGDSIEMRQKGLLRGHPKLSKKSKNAYLGLKLEEICLVKVDHFCKIAKSQMCWKMHFLPNGLTFLCLHLTHKVVHNPITYPHVIFFIIYFIFIFYY